MTTTAASDELTQTRPCEVAVPSPCATGPDRTDPARGRPPIGPAAASTGVAALAVLWRRLVMFVVGTGLILGTFELGLLLTEKEAVHVRKFGRRRPTPYVEFYSQPDYHGEGIDTNEEGFRYGPLPVDKPPDETRVFFLGSSFGFRGETNETTIAGFMEKQLAALKKTSGRRVRVVNASGTSFSSTQSLVLLVTRVLRYEPDVIVVFHGPEALLYPTVYESRPGYPFNFRVRERLYDKVAGKTVGAAPVLDLLMKARVARRFHPNLGRNARQEELSRYNNVITIESLEQYDPYIDVVVRDAQDMARIASAYGCRTLVAVPPWKSPALLPGAMKRLADCARQAFAHSNEHGAAFVDASQLIDVMNARGLWRPDGVHWDDSGNRLIAGHLAAALLDAGFLD